MKKASAQFVAGLARLLIDDFTIKARRGALLAYPPKGMEAHALRRVVDKMKTFDSWKWEADDKVFISYYPKG